MLFASTIWAVVEARFDFWQLLPRLWVWLILAIWLLPPVTNRLALGPPAVPREGVLPLAGAVVLVVLLGIVTAFNHPYDRPGQLDQRAVSEFGSIGVHSVTTTISASTVTAIVRACRRQRSCDGPSVRQISQHEPSSV